MPSNVKIALLKVALYATALGVPLAIGFLESWPAAGGVGPVLALLLREVDKLVIEPLEAEYGVTPTVDNTDPVPPALEG